MIQFIVGLLFVPALIGALFFGHWLRDKLDRRAPHTRTEED